MSVMRFAVAVSLILAGGVAPSGAEERAPLVMPEFLHEVAESRGCSPFDDFYRSASAIYPPYVLGVVWGDHIGDAAFWCQRKPLEAVLMFALRGEYAGEIVFSGGPAGLRIVRDGRPTVAAEPREIPDQNNTHPRNPGFQGRYFILGNETVEYLFYSKGIWYTAPGGH